MIENNLHILLRRTDAPSQNTGIETMPRFHKNETVIGKVLRLYAPGKALLLIKGEKVEVKAHMPLKAGTSVVLQVKNLSPVPTLKYLGENPQGLRPSNLPIILSAVTENIWKSAIDSSMHSNLAKEDSTNLLGLLKTMAGDLFKNGSTDLLKALITVSGFNLEAKIKKALNHHLPKIETGKLIENDLKGMILKILNRNPDGPKHLKKLLTVIESIQHLNQDDLEQGKKIYLPFPMAFSDGSFGVAQLLLHLPAGDQEHTIGVISGSDVLKATFLLEMSLLGPIRAEFTLKGKVVEGMFLVVEKRTKEILEKNLNSFTDALKDKQFFIQHVGCFLKDTETVARPLLTSFVQEGNSSICLVG